MSYVEGIYEFITRTIEKLARSLRSLTHYKHLLIVAILFSLAGCIGKSAIEVNFKKPKKNTVVAPLSITVSNVQVIDHQIIITGTNLTAVSNFKIKEGSNDATLQIESQTSTSIVANTLSDVTFAAGKVFDFIFSSAMAASTFTVNFSLCDSTLGGKGFNCAITPNDKDVLSYDAVSGKWKPKAVNGLSYQGSWDATTGEPVTSTAGDYFIVSVADAPYQVGDWIVFNGTTFDRIDNSQMITSVFGRTGVVTALEGDYNLTKLSDVIITAPAANQVLTYNGADWVNGAATYTESDPLVSAFAKATLPTCGAGQVLKGDGTSLSCVSDNAGTSFSGTANRAVITDGTGALTSSSINTTIFNYLSNVTSDIQTQLNAKQGTLGTGTVTSTHILDGTITDADLAGSIAQSKITNLTTDLGNKQNTSTLSADVRAILLDGLSTATNAVITATDSILSAFGKLQKQITDLNSTTLKTTGGTLIVGTIDGVPNPSTANQVANKAYVDSAVSSPSVTCPTNYILVPANTTYFPKQFCVSKYEMKNDGYGTAVSQATGTPWVSINRPTSRSKCQALGSGYDMISNDQWQTIARNIAGVASNWDSGTVASGQLNRGHSDNAPASALAAVTDDNDPCNGTGQTCSSSVWDSQRRTHTLSNGNKIWDFAGNVWEWVTNDSNVSNGGNGYISTMSGGDIRQTRYGAASGTICATPGSSPYCGMGHGWFNYTAGAVVRGGDWSSDVGAGVFASALYDAPTGAYTIFGFRCVFVP